MSAFAPIDLSDLETAEGKGEFILVQGHILGQRHRQIEAQGEISISLGKAVDLFLSLSATFGQQDFAGFNDGSVQGSKSIEGVRLAQNIHHPVKLHLPAGQQLHKAG